MTFPTTKRQERSTCASTPRGGADGRPVAQTRPHLDRLPICLDAEQPADGGVLRPLLWILLQWLPGERLAFAQRLLESIDHPIEAIAALARFGSAVSLRHHFRKAFAVSPTSWRQAFRGP